MRPSSYYQALGLQDPWVGHKLLLEAGVERG